MEQFRIHLFFKRVFKRETRIGNLKLIAVCFLFSIVVLTGCEVQRRKSDAELGLNPQQIAGRRIYDNYCDRCHAPYSSRGRQGPSMKGVFQRQYLPTSGMPANDDRVTDIVRMGRNKMPGYAQVLSQQQINDLLAYLHTL
ncbi:MAG TPA: cytochrome c [Terriglobales bacterium]|nr:cytochrome c [Terriglobales bacterium]